MSPTPSKMNQKPKFKIPHFNEMKTSLAMLRSENSMPYGSATESLYENVEAKPPINPYVKQDYPNVPGSASKPEYENVETKPPINPYAQKDACYGHVPCVDPASALEGKCVT